MFVAGPLFPLLLVFFSRSVPACLIPFRIRDVPLLAIAPPVILWYPEYRARDMAAINYRPWSVVSSCTVPAVPTRRPPVSVEKKHIDPGLGHEVDLGTRYRDHFRRRTYSNRRGAYVNVDLHSCQRLISPHHGKHRPQKSGQSKDSVLASLHFYLPHTRFLIGFLTL